MLSPNWTEQSHYLAALTYEHCHGNNAIKSADPTVRILHSRPFSKFHLADLQTLPNLPGDKESNRETRKQPHEGKKKFGFLEQILYQTMLTYNYRKCIFKMAITLSFNNKWRYLNIHALTFNKYVYSGKNQHSNHQACRYLHDCSQRYLHLI